MLLIMSVVFYRRRGDYVMKFSHGHVTTLTTWSVVYSDRYIEGRMGSNLDMEDWDIG